MIIQFDATFKGQRLEHCKTSLIQNVFLYLFYFVWCKEHLSFFS